MAELQKGLALSVEFTILVVPREGGSGHGRIVRGHALNEGLEICKVGAG